MNKKIILILAIVGVATAGGIVMYRHYQHHQKASEFFTAKSLNKRTITQEIKATGYTEVNDMMKIGSLIQGVILKMYVEENDRVKKGQLLADIDDGIGDTQVREKKAILESSKAALVYAKPHFDRQKALYEQGYISKDVFEKATSDYEQAQQAVKRDQAMYDRAVIIFNNKKIVAPDPGIVIAKVASEGETVALTSPATIIYTIAKDITKMKVRLEIDETVVADVHAGQTARLIFDAYPDRRFEGTIADISRASKQKGGAVTYLATIHLDNSEQLFRPNMSVSAYVIVGEKNDVLAAPVNIFKFNPMLLKDLADKIGYEFKELCASDRKACLAKDHTRTLWVVSGKTFVEKPVNIGINDHAFYEIISGVDTSEKVLVDMLEPDAMKELFKKLFGKGL